MVQLNRPSDIMTPTGKFCCEVPDATDTVQTLCMNVGKRQIIHNNSKTSHTIETIGGLSITASGSAIAGESYILECSTGGSVVEGFQWLKGLPDSRTPVVSNGSILISSTSTTSRLQFMPIQQSDNGSYLCSAVDNGQTLSSESTSISVNGINLNQFCDCNIARGINHFSLQLLL